MPPIMNGRRRPIRVRVRSLQMPMNGAVSITHRAPAPVMYPRYSWFAGASSPSRTAREMAMGVMKAMKTPNCASTMNQMYRALTGGRSSCGAASATSTSGSTGGSGIGAGMGTTIGSSRFGLVTAGLHRQGGELH